MYLILITFLITPSLAHAYLDPGTGTALINIIIAGIIAIIYGMRGLFIRLIHKNKTVLEENKEVNEQVKISIFNEGKQYRDSYMAIIEGLIEDGIAFNYFTLDIEDPILMIENNLVKSKFLGYGLGQKAKFMSIKSDILLTTTPNIGAKGYFPKPKNVRKLIHFFHSVSEISVYKKHSLDFYDAVYMAGNFQQKSIRDIENKRKTKKKELIPLGLPYLDNLLNSKLNLNIKNKTKTILVGSSWGAKGLLNHYGTKFIKQISTMKYNIIVRPHPQSLISEKHLIDKYKSELENIENVFWDDTINPSASLGAADILISDTSSLRFDFAFIYEKPVITLDIPKTAMLGYEREDLEAIWSDIASKKIGYVIDDSDLNKLEYYISIINDEFDRFSLINFREATISNFGCSVKAIIKQLQSEIGQ